MTDFNSNYVLVLPSWYPSKLDKFNGDFNERLVHAVANYRAQIVVYVSTKKRSNLEEIEISEEKNVIIYKAYFIYSRFNLVNAFRMFKLYSKIFKIIFKEHGLPLLVHNYVFFPSGLVSVYLKYRYKLKIVLTEHWTLFNYADNEKHIYTHSLFQKLIYSIILRVIDSVISVSESLGLSISEWTKGAKTYILPNVVDTTFFNRIGVEKLDKQYFNFIHVSDIGMKKNVESMLNVFSKLLKTGAKVKLTLIGEERENILKIIKDNDLLKENVSFLGEVSYKHVAENMKNSDAFILFSKYENMPCVILEALCCGLPIISSSVGGIATVVNKTNGLLVESENEEQLYEAIILMMKNYHQYDTKSISENAISAYNYKHIGKQTDEIYLETLG